jgi:hypothetical protein
MLKSESIMDLWGPVGTAGDKILREAEVSATSSKENRAHQQRGDHACEMEEILRGLLTPFILLPA